MYHFGDIYMMIEYKKEYYTYNHNYNFYDFMDTEIFRILIKDIRQAKKDNNLEITIERDIEPVYFYGEFEGYQNNGEYLTINGEQVIAMPPYAIYGLMRYVHKYVGLSV